MLGRRSFEIFVIPNLASVRCHTCKRSALLTNTSIRLFLQRDYFLSRIVSTNTLSTLRYNKPNILSPAKIFSSKTSQFYLSSRVEKDTTRTNNAEEVKRANRNYALYFTAGFFLFIGVAYASAPLYKAFCQATNLGGELNIHLRDEKAAKLETIDPVKEFGQITVKFYSAKESRLAWDFKPQQDSVKVYPGETALAFYTATNPTSEPIVGVSTYNIIPYEAAPYFNKIQCFCFDDQRLEPNESVDMPVFFYIDPDITKDYRCKNAKEIVLGYTFFESKGGLELPPANTPGVAKQFEKQY